MIPKIIHYIWFGKNSYSQQVLKCIQSWKMYCADYKIKQWSEENFEISDNTFAKEAYDSKKWAFVSDYARLKILYEYGGIYLDTDMEILQKIDDFLSCEMFLGFESKNSVAGGIIGIQKANPLVLELLKIYENRKFILENGEFDTTPIVYFIANLLAKQGFKLNNRFQKIDGICLYPSEFFYPKSNFSGKLNLSSNSHTIHHYDGSWLDETQRLDRQKRYVLTGKFGKILGMSIYRAQKIAKNLRQNGLKNTLNLIKKRLKSPLW